MGKDASKACIAWQLLYYTSRERRKRSLRKLVGVTAPEDALKFEHDWDYEIPDDEIASHEVLPCIIGQPHTYCHHV